MNSSSRPALAFGVLTALLWGPNCHIVRSLALAGVPSFTLCFHLLLWPALLCFVFLLIGGRWQEVAVFKRRETQMLVLAATGGYGFWALRAAALEASGSGGAEAWIYLAPLMVWAISLMGRERGDAKALVGLLLGLAGCAMLLVWGSEQPAAATPLRARLFGAAAALCWALFSILLRPVGRDVKTLPLVFLITAIGAVCMGVTCLSTGDGLFSLGTAELRRAGLAGLLTVGAMMGAWSACLRRIPAWRAGLLWYLGALAGTVWGRLHGMPMHGWFAFGGAALILLGICAGFAGARRSHSVTLGDVIRR